VKRAIAGCTSCKLVHRFTGADVILRTPAGEVPGSTLPAPAALPRRGTVAYAGRTYHVSSFTVTAFPSGPLQVSILMPGSRQDRPPVTADPPAHEVGEGLQP
jgi:hypothetical protein